MNTWNFLTAKSCLHAIVEKCLETGPQVIATPVESVVLLSKTTYDHLTGNKPDFTDFLNPLPITDFDVTEYQYY